MNSALISLFRMKKKSALFLLTGVILSMVLGACSVRKTYFGPELAKEQIAVVKPVKKLFTDVEIKSLDGYEPGYFDSGYTVLPGIHTMIVHVMMDYPCLHDNLHFTLELSFEAQAGHTYRVRGTILPLLNDGYVWVESDKEPDVAIVTKHADSLELLSASTP